MNCFFIINPQSRNGRSGKKSAELFSLLDRSGLKYEYAFTESLDHACRLSRKANEEGAGTIVAVGGDGTINRVLCGFFDPHGHRISRAKMGVIHTGTSPDFCKSYSIPRALPQAVNSIEKGMTSLVRIGMIEYASSPTCQKGDAPQSPIFFGCCANIGLGASLARAANSGIRKYAGDTAGTFISLLRVLAGYRPAMVSLTIDGRQQEIGRVYDIAIGRTRFIASGIQVRHQLGPLDPRLYILTVKNLNAFNLAKVLKVLYRGKTIPNNGPALSLSYGSRIEISATGPVEVECDGDPAGYCPCTISTAPDALELIVGGPDAR